MQFLSLANTYGRMTAIVAMGVVFGCTGSPTKGIDYQGNARDGQSGDLCELRRSWDSRSTTDSREMMRDDGDDVGNGSSPFDAGTSQDSDVPPAMGTCKEIVACVVVDCALVPECSEACLKLGPYEEQKKYSALQMCEQMCWMYPDMPREDTILCSETGCKDEYTACFSDGTLQCSEVLQCVIGCSHSAEHNLCVQACEWELAPDEFDQWFGLQACLRLGELALPSDFGAVLDLTLHCYDELIQCVGEVDSCSFSWDWLVDCGLFTQADWVQCGAKAIALDIAAFSDAISCVEDGCPGGWDVECYKEVGNNECDDTTDLCGLSQE